jgi:hypothetical protein
MRNVNFTRLAGIVFLAPCDLLTVACGRTLEPNAQPTTTPPPSPQPTTTPAHDLIQIASIADLGEPVAGPVFEGLLRRIPDNSLTRDYLSLSNFAGTLEPLGIEKIDPAADLKTQQEFMDELVETFDRNQGRSKFWASFPA